MKTSHRTHTIISRRQFIGGASLASAAFMVVPGRVLGLDGNKSPNEKLNIAGIGVAGQGNADLNQFQPPDGKNVKEDGCEENVVALCDVDWRHAAGTFKQYPKAKQYKDFRKMLEEQKDIDAVVVATPDHVHAFASMMAMKMGKHVYCEKPLTHSVWEARQIGEAARTSKVATQMGNQGQASEETRRLCEYVWAGAIGPVREAHIWTDRPSNGLFKEYWPQGVSRPKETPPVPETLDWDLWLGPAPFRPYSAVYMPFVWRGWWDFGTGALGDIGCHALDPVFRALKLGAPLSVEASSTRVNEDTYPLSSMVTYHFPARGDMPPIKLVWYDGGVRPPRPEGLDEERTMGSNGQLLIGDKGFLLGGQLFPDSRRNEFAPPPKTLPRSVGHHKEWVEACKGGKPAGSNFTWAGPLAEAVLLGNVALRMKLREELTRHKLLWDPAKLQITNVPQANEFVRREYREGWKLA